MTKTTQTQLTVRYCPECGTRVGRYGCDVCNSKYFATTIQPRTCPIDGGKIRPATDKMTGMWWIDLPSHRQTWRCDGCGFVGNFLDFATEANKHSTCNEDAGNAAAMRYGQF